MKRVTFSVLILLFAIGAYGAQLSKGTLGGKKSKFYHFTSLDDGHVTITCIFDNKAANIDIGLGVNGELVAASVSSQGNYEQLKAGTIFGTRWTILLLNENGAGTPFRLIVEGGEAEDVATGSSLNSEFTKLQRKFLDVVRLIQQSSVGAR